MTITLAYDRDAARKRAEHASRPPSRGEGFYGPDIRSYFDRKPSLVFRATEYYWSHRWPAIVTLLAVCAAVAFGIVSAV